MLTPSPVHYWADFLRLLSLSYPQHISLLYDVQTALSQKQKRKAASVKQEGETEAVGESATET